ncbi:hypothetical protein JTE90_009379 [Oedothorax gibbosus]|uniref:Uncharacterized protein n=1 Tax=Oedothorax gibbosus TaxID=931172 RepID=A0AAV6VU24_9ARAC|nr:hypothetical protein JTE90_009379 [Oedothorax gibbosus]
MSSEDNTTRKKPMKVPSSVASKQTLLKNRSRIQSSKDASFRSYPKSGAESNVGNTSECNLLYAEYLQAKLLEINCMEAAQKRSKLASEKIHKIWSLMQVLMIKNNKVYKELNFVSHLIKLHKHLEKQEEMLSPVLEVIPKLESQYESIATAVDIVQHKLEVKNMSVSKDKETEEAVIDLLKKISNLVRSLKSMRDSDKVIGAAEVSDTFLEQGKLVTEEIKRAENLLSEVNDLLLDETSLKLAFTN